MVRRIFTKKAGGSSRVRNSIDSGILLGRASKGRGAIEQITIPNIVTSMKQQGFIPGGFIGSVTSVSVTMPTQFGVGGSPITGAGTIAISWNTEAANTVLAGPTTGSAAVPTFRPLVAADIPALSGTYLPLAGGTMTGAIVLPNGAAGTPELAFNTNYGLFYTTSSPDGALPGMAVAHAGNAVAAFNTNGLAICAQPSGTATTLRVAGDGAGANLTFRGFVSSTASPNLNMQKGRGTIASPAVPQTNDFIATIMPQMWVSGTGTSPTFGTAGTLRAVCVETSTVDATHLGTRWVLSSCPIGSGTNTELARWDNETGFSLFGANPVIDKNRLVILRNFATASLPASPATGAIAYDSTTSAPKFYNGSAWTAIGGGTGTVTSVSLSLPADLTVSGSPVTTSGTLSAVWANENANTVHAGPTSGGAATPTWRALVAADIPALGANPSATASDVAVSGTATTYMRSDGAPAVQKATTGQFGLVKPDGTTVTISAGVISATQPAGANPSATASNVAVNGSAATFMRSDAAPAIQLGSSSQYGLVKVDNSTITAASGIISAVGSGGAALLSPFFDTGAVALTKPTTTGWTVLNSTAGTGTLANLTSRGVGLKVPAGASAVTSAEQTCPSSTTFTATAMLYPQGAMIANWFWGIAVKDNAGKYEAFGVHNSSPAIFSRFTFTAISGTIATTNIGGAFNPNAPMWLKLQCTGGNFVFSVSFDGENFVTVLTESQTTFLASTLSTVGLLVENNVSPSTALDTMFLDCFSWTLTNP